MVETYRKQRRGLAAAHRLAWALVALAVLAGLAANVRVTLARSGAPLASGYQLASYVVASGGATAQASSGYTLSGTIGQPVAGRAVKTPFSLGPASGRRLASLATS